MTGFNERVVNPAMKPLKGYWMVIDDCGFANETWERVAWSNNLPLAGCAMEVYVRANDNRQALANEPFVLVTNNVPLAGVKGRFLEVRVALSRDDPSQEPVLYDLTLFGLSSAFAGVGLQETSARETETATFWANVIGPAPLTYQWSRLYPWASQWEVITGETGATFAWTNVDQWESNSYVSVWVTNAAGQFWPSGPAKLTVLPMPIRIPGDTNATSGQASNYPAKINVRGEPTSGLDEVWVTLNNLSHAHPADLDILLVSPSSNNIILMSDAGSTAGVTNATLVFHPLWDVRYGFPPETNAISSNLTSHYRPANYGDQETNHLETLPPYVAPAGPYTGFLDDLANTNPNGIWELYIYDDTNGATGMLQGSWSLKFFYDN